MCPYCDLHFGWSIFLFFHFQSYTQHITNIIYTVHEFIYQLSLSMCVSFLRIKIHRKHRLIKKEKTLYKSYYSLHLLTDLFVADVVILDLFLWFYACLWVWCVCVSVFISFEINRWMAYTHTNEEKKTIHYNPCLEFAKIRLSNLSDIFLSFFSYSLMMMMMMIGKDMLLNIINNMNKISIMYFFVCFVLFVKNIKFEMIND